MGKRNWVCRVQAYPLLGEPACLQRVQVCPAPSPLPAASIPGARPPHWEVCPDSTQPATGWVALLEPRLLFGSHLFAGIVSHILQDQQHCRSQRCHFGLHLPGFFDLFLKGSEFGERRRVPFFGGPCQTPVMTMSLAPNPDNEKKEEVESLPWSVMCVVNSTGTGNGKLGSSERERTRVFKDWKTPVLFEHLSENE